VKIVMVHNQGFGGAHRRMSEQWRHLGLPLTEIILEGAESVTGSAVVIPMARFGDAANSFMKPLARYADLLAVGEAYRRLNAAVRNQAPDVVWINPCQYLQAPLITRDLARRTVYYCDEPRRIDYEPQLRASIRARSRIPYWPIRRACRQLDRRTATTAAVLATNSRYTAGCIRGAYARDARIVRCGVSGKFRPPDRPRERAYLLSVGKLIPTKGHDLAIAAAGRARIEIPLLIASHASNPQEEVRLRRLADEAGVDLTIRVGVTDEQLVELYQDALVTLYLAYAEPFGLASIEAQASGCPVIVSKEGGLPETIVDGATGWAVPRTIDAVAEALARVHDGDSLDEVEVAAARHGSRWSWQQSARALLALLQDVAGS
jgi:glycosyltransferase involved in cell wall biosynthesis